MKIILLILSLSFGGVEVFAAKRFKYDVIVQKSDSNVKTFMQVLSENEQNAKEELYLNGWKVLKITLSKEQLPENDTVVPVAKDEKPSSNKNVKKKVKKSQQQSKAVPYIKRNKPAKSVKKAYVKVTSKCPEISHSLSNAYIVYLKIEDIADKLDNETLAKLRDNVSGKNILFLYTTDNVSKMKQIKKLDEATKDFAKILRIDESNITVEAFVSQANREKSDGK